MTVFAALDYVRSPETMNELTEREAHLLTVLAVFTGRHGTSHPSVAQLAELMRVTEATVRRARAGLVRKGRVAVRPGGGRGRANEYLLARGANPEQLSTTRAPARGFTAETRAETRALARDQEQGDVLTSTDAVPRAAPPWRAEGISRQVWLLRQRGWVADG